METITMSGSGSNKLFIDPDDETELGYWLEELGVPEECLRQSLARVGNAVEDVRQDLALHYTG